MYNSSVTNVSRQSRAEFNRVRSAGVLMVLATLFVGSTLRSSAELAFQVLYTFPTSNSYPWVVNKLIEGKHDDFYGTSFLGGSNNCGTVFRVTKAGDLTMLFSFNGTNGQGPSGGLTRGNDGEFFGTTAFGGNGLIDPSLIGSGLGTIFKITTNGDLTTLAYFEGTNGSSPRGSLTMGADGNFYGATSYGGSNFPGQFTGEGTVFRVTTNGVLSTLISFSGADGSEPHGGLVLGNDGFFYGTTYGGGDTADGTIFKITTNGTLTTLWSFDGTNGSGPEASLTLGSDGNLYGTTGRGGSNSPGPFAGNGTIFKVTTNGELTTLLFFSGTNGSQSGALAQGNDGNFYGTTAFGGSSDYGTLFKVATNGVLTTLVHFDGTNGIHPFSNLILGRDGNLYGALADANANRLPNGDSIIRLAETPVLTGLTLTNGSVNLSWTSFTNGIYQVEFKPSLTATAWMQLPPAVTAAGSTTHFMDSSEKTTERYYRVVLTR